jgi:hypothetical protein
MQLYSTLAIKYVPAETHRYRAFVSLLFVMLSYFLPVLFLYFLGTDTQLYQQSLHDVLFRSQQLTNMMMLQNLEVIFNKFNVDRICT